jgi:tetratricopeptide (TPR) repeat protein
VRQAQGRSREAIRWARQAIDEAEGSGARAALAHALYILDWAQVDIGEPGGGYAARALEIYVELGDLGKQGLVDNYLGAIAYFEGRWNDALGLYERARDARERTGDPVNAAEGTANIGEILSDQGHLQEAEELLKGALSVLRAAGYHGTIAFVTGLLGRIAYRAGRLDEGLRLLREAAERFAQAGSRGGALEIEARIAEWHLFAGDPDAALALADAALARAQTMGGTVFRPMLHRVRGYALMASVRRDDAREALEESLRLGRAARADYEVVQTLEACVRLDRLEGRATTPVALTEYRSILERLGIVDQPAVPLP